MKTQVTKSGCDSVEVLLGDLEGKSFKIALWPKDFFFQPAETETVTWEQLVVMFFGGQITFVRN